MKKIEINTIFLLQIVLIITLIFCLLNWNNTENFNSIQDYNVSIGHCGSKIDDNDNIEYPNYILKNINNVNECKKECNNMDNCQGYNFDNDNNDEKCKLYSFNGEKKGTNNTQLIIQGYNPNDKHKNLNCYVKNNFVKQGKTMTQYVYDILNSRENDIKGLYDTMNKSFDINIKNNKDNEKKVLNYIDKITDNLVYHTLTDVNETNYDVVNF